MTLSRRQLLHLSVLSIGTSVLSLATGYRPSVNVAEVHAGSNTLDMAHVSLTEFESVKSSIFTVNHPDQKICHLKLVQVSELEKTDNTEGFYFRLQGRSDEAALEQGTYHVSHPKLGGMTLFMVPGKSDRLRQTYNVVVNRLVS